MDPADIGRIHAEARVTALFSLQHDECLTYWGIDYRAMCRVAERWGLVMRRRPIRDFDVADMQRNLPSAVSSLARLCSAGHRTYVHCTAGLGRAPLAVLGYLIWIEKRPAADAVELLREGRPGAVPAWEAFHGADRDMEIRFRGDIEHRAFELFQAGVHNDAPADWNHAKSEVIKVALAGWAGDTPI